jgi:glycosyltransferase involved in cell wall biosynthesis
LSGREIAEAENLGLRPGQLLHKTGDDHVLANCYRNAAALVYPSLYEGFGIPPLEAMACSCPVICSQTSSLPEVVGDAGEYFDPHQEDDMMAAMERVLLSPNRRQDLVAKGLSQCAKFSWNKCAVETLKIYKTLL